MRWSTYISPSDGREHIAVADGDRLYGLAQPSRLLELLADRTALEEAAEHARTSPFEVIDPAGVQLRAPVPVPPSIRDFIAFEEHVRNASSGFGRQVNPVWYEVPLFYFTNPAAVRGPNEPVAIAPGSEAFDYELEIGMVIGRPGRDLDPATAEEHIAGLMIFCDWSSRDLQRREQQGNLGPAKGKDTATTFGPWLLTADELSGRRAGNAWDLEMTATVNGKRYSHGNLSSIYWTPGQILAYASRGTELRTGDVIGTGTVGSGCILELSALHGSEAYPWLQAGDTVEPPLSPSDDPQRLGLAARRIPPWPVRRASGVVDPSAHRERPVRRSSLGGSAAATRVPRSRFGLLAEISRPSTGRLVIAAGTVLTCRVM